MTVNEIVNTQYTHFSSPLMTVFVSMFFISVIVCISSLQLSGTDDKLYRIFMGFGLTGIIISCIIGIVVLVGTNGTDIESDGYFYSNESQSVRMFVDCDTYKMIPDEYKKDSSKHRNMVEIPVQEINENKSLIHGNVTTYKITDEAKNNILSFQK